MSITLDEMAERFKLDRPQTFTLLPDPEPREVFCPIVSADDHVVEPPDIFDGRFPKKYRDDAPRIVDTENGGQAWLWIGKILPNIGLNAVVGRPREELTFEPTRFEHMRRGTWDVKARLVDMDINGVWASVCFPSFLPGFVGQRLTLWPDDEGLAWEAMRAYNDWHLEAWCGADARRFIPNQIAWLRDPVKAGEEIRRNAARGFTAVSFSEAPHRLGLPSIHSGYWDPFLAACAETETVVNLHVGSSGESFTTSDDAPGELAAALFSASSFTYATDWLYSGVAERLPDIKICMSEGGIGWAASVIDRADHLTARKELNVGQGREPHWASSEVFRRNFWLCALDEACGFAAAEAIGIDRIMAESDYPHSDSTWPDTQPLLKAQLAGLSQESVEKVCWKNAVELYRHSAPPADWAGVT
jgi:predicted TIM-barrel fold metal-dependent hydrolase